MDRLNINSQLEHLQSKYVGTGHADTIKHEWLVNQHRDTNAAFVGHQSMLSYFAVAENESLARVKFNLIQKMVQPCGPPPEREDQ
ncbi:hypothetical protein INT44_002397 [Umbelopsis vinacea]|uniref:Splicing factor subunit n=2 Tax=Umbelopsis TaxID=64561 RepID=A0A8H7UNU0_9FUNG|nr:uncharacterized protein K450DRAFT_231404 [Umbelopsis ramanniana AG]KAG2185604.1 hypothetical protein INT44_002397 [Umbelopsis vinacea]KAI8581840.1 hypothetical protein K450DRAFT_231404 [Umbelopsis ramanniana AG]KAI9285044.1 splicing factor 3B subunit 5/RDS3 complex subunit 10 [Umbelopsis sp. AD052]